MSIIGEELPDYVQKQINVRQKTHASGWNDQRTPQQLTYLNSRTAWVKLASGNYLSKDKIDELGLDPQFVGAGLAKNHILFGGFSSINTNSESSNFEVNQRTGFIGNEFTSNAYEIGKDFGIVPMPGIVSMDVKALNRGSIKKAIVKIKVQNRDQLTIIDTLYLRLGYTVLLEWGNSIYLDNDDSLMEVRETVLDDNKYFFNRSWNVNTDPNTGKKTTTAAYDNALEAIEKYRKEYDGNYDGLLGKVSNFNWTFNSDGSYDVELTIISYGDVIESLKTNITAKNETYNFVNEQSIPTHAGRTIQDHRTDNILFTLLHSFKILSDKDSSKKVQVDGADYGWFIQQGTETIIAKTFNYVFSASYDLYQHDFNSGNDIPVKDTDFSYYQIETFDQNDSKKDITGDTDGLFAARYKTLFNDDISNRSYDSSLFGNKLPTAAFHIKGQTWVRTNGSNIATPVGSSGTEFTVGDRVSDSKFIRNYTYYELKHIINGPERFTITVGSGLTGTSFSEKPLGKPALSEDGLFKLLFLGPQDRNTTSRYKNYSTTALSTNFITAGSIGAGWQMPQNIWGIKSINSTHYGKTKNFIYDGLETQWLTNTNGTIFTNPKVNVTFSDPLYQNQPQANTTTTTFQTALNAAFEAWKDLNKFPQDLHKPPVYDNNGNSNNGYEFFHRFVGEDRQKAIDENKEFFWKPDFKLKELPNTSKPVENPLFSIKPYDDRGAIRLNYVDPTAYYMRFGFLLQIIQDKVTLKINKGTTSENTPIFNIAYQTGSFDMLCLPNQMSFDLTKCLVRRDSVTRDWDTALKASKLFDSAHPWYHGDDTAIYGSGNELKTNVADIMNIYIDFDFIGQCMLSATDERGNMSTYGLINNICIGLNKALAGVNNLEPVIDETSNTLYIIDSSPKYDYKKEKKGIYELQLYGYQEYKGQKEPESTFVRKVDLKTAITPEYATMITIGATAGGYAKGTEATAFSRWNKGIEDRFKADFIPGDESSSAGVDDYKEDIKDSYQQMMTKTNNSLGITDKI
jgi:hypothetical protein